MKMCTACTQCYCDLVFIHSKNDLFNPYMSSPACSSSDVHALSLNGDKVLQKEEALINLNDTQPLKYNSLISGLPTNSHH